MSDQQTQFSQELFERIYSFYTQAENEDLFQILKKDRNAWAFWFRYVNILRGSLSGRKTLLKSKARLNRNRTKEFYTVKEALAYLPTKMNKKALSQYLNYKNSSLEFGSFYGELNENSQILHRFPLRNIRHYAEILGSEKYLNTNPYLYSQLLDGALFFELGLEVFKQAQNRSFITTNDHSGDCNGLIFAAKSQGLETQYIQHAAVASTFPALIFDRAFLQNHKSLEIYDSIAQEKTVPNDTKCVVMNENPRANLRPLSEPYALAIILTSVPNIEKMQKLIDKFYGDSRFTSIEIVLHPRFRKNMKKFEQKYPDIKISRGIESIKEAQNYVAIVGNTSSTEELLDAGWKVYYSDQLDDIKNDYYGFVKSGQIENVNTLLKENEP